MDESKEEVALVVDEERAILIGKHDAYALAWLLKSSQQDELRSRLYRRVFVNKSYAACVDGFVASFVRTDGHKPVLPPIMCDTEGIYEVGHVNQQSRATNVTARDGENIPDKNESFFSMKGVTPKAVITIDTKRLRKILPSKEVVTFVIYDDAIPMHIYGGINLGKGDHASTFSIIMPMHTMEVDAWNPYSGVLNRNVQTRDEDALNRVAEYVDNTMADRIMKPDEVTFINDLVRSLTGSSERYNQFIGDFERDFGVKWFQGYDVQDNDTQQDES